MSRLAKKPINIPAEVKVSVEGDTLVFKGPKGELKKTFPENIVFALEGTSLGVALKKEGKKKDPSLGSTASLIKNAIAGVSAGFEKKLEIVGIGYRAQLQGRNLQLALGYSHPVLFPLPEGIQAEVDRQVVITLRGADKALVGQVAANVRALRPPEPYKGKGIKYVDETIRRKVGKSGAK